MELTVIEIKRRIYSVRGYQVVLDNDLADLFQIETRILNRYPQRNPDRFPSDFMFKLTSEEYKVLISQASFIGTKHGGRRHAPHAYTELGIAMLSLIIGTERAALVNVEITRTFALSREMAHTETYASKRLDRIEDRLDQMEQKHDGQFKMILQGICQLLEAKSVNKLPALPAPEGAMSNTDVPATHPAATPNAKKQQSGKEQKAENFGVQAIVLGKESCLKTKAIHQAVADYFGLKTDDLKKVCRARSIVLPRQIAIYLVRKNTASSFKEIGSQFGIKDHTTVLHAYEKISKDFENGGDLKEVVLTIQKTLAH